MTHEAVLSHCLTFPGALHDRPFGPDTEVMKVGGKMFAVWGTSPDGVTLKVKDAETARFLKEIGAARTAPYLKRGGWVMIAWDDDTLPQRLRESYEIVKASLPKTVRDQIG